MTEWLLSAFADEAGGGIADQIRALRENGLTHIEPRGLDEGNISEYTPSQCRELRKILDDGGIGVSAYLLFYRKDFPLEFPLLVFPVSWSVVSLFDCKFLQMFSRKKSHFELDV